MDLYPAIDIRDGTAVRLAQGDFDRQRAYGDPLELAEQFAAAGAPWLHVVDLDAARSGRPVNRGVVTAVARAVPVIASGGVSSVRDVEVLGALAVASEEGGPRRVSGVIAGRALVEGRLTVEEGVAACARSG